MNSVDPEMALSDSRSSSQSCPHCSAAADISEYELLEVISCRDCEQTFAVSGQIGPYQVTGVAGRGGMGVVYRAYDPSLDREIALKLLRKSHSADAGQIRQLEEEAAIMASITDPNVVRVIGTGWDRGRFFLAMELADGGSLDDVIRAQGTVPEVPALHVAIQSASGLRAAWRCGLIHRDVKPGNILFTADATAKIVDFGLAIFMHQQESGSGGVWGTPYYLAPEKLDQQPEDFRSDMYSLGATMFHALTGRPPFEAENTTLIAIKHLMSQVVSVQAFAPWVSHATAHIINRMLAKNPKDRFTSYDELIQNLEYALRENHKHGGAADNQKRIVLETEEDRKTWTVVVLVMIALMAVVIGVVMAGPKSRTAETISKASPVPQSGTRIASLEYALKALGRRDEKAAGMFAEAAENGMLSSQDKAWCAFLESLAHLSTTRPVEARASLAKVNVLADAIKDTDVRKFLKNTAVRLQRTEPISDREMVQLNRRNHEAIAPLAYGLHHFAAGRLEEAIPFLKEFRSSTAEGSYAWFHSLDAMANSLIEDIGVIVNLRQKMKRANHIAEKFDVAVEIRNLPPSAASLGKDIIDPYTKELDAYAATANTLPARGVYRIVNRRSGMVLDVRGEDRNPGALVDQYHDVRFTNQAWELYQFSEGSYLLRALVGESVLDVPSGNMKERGTVQMATITRANSQRWWIELYKDGYFKIRSKATNLLLSADGALIDQQADHNDPAQLWRFQRDGDVLNGAWWRLSVGDQGDARDKAEVNGGVFELTSHGQDIWWRQDDCTFVGRSGATNFDLSARLVSLSGAAVPKAGLMVRTSMAADRPNVMIELIRGQILTQQRPKTGDQTALLQSQEEKSNPADRNSAPAGRVQPPVWLKLEKRGNVISSFQSTDGIRWKLQSSTEIPASHTVFAGMAIASRERGKPAVAEFDSVVFLEK